MTGRCVSLCAAAVSLWASAALAEIDVLSVTLTYENATEIPVPYFNASDGSGAAAMLIDGQLIAMRQAESGSDHIETRACCV